MLNFSQGTVVLIPNTCLSIISCLICTCFDTVLYTTSRVSPLNPVSLSLKVQTSRSWQPPNQIVSTQVKSHLTSCSCYRAEVRDRKQSVANVRWILARYITMGSCRTEYSTTACSIADGKD